MSDYRYQIVERNGIQCLKVMIDGSEPDGSIQTYIPIDDIFSSWFNVSMKEKQQIMPAYEGLVITPPALFTNEMLEQIRAVVREELAAANEQEDDTSTDDSSSDGTISGTISQDWKLTDLGKQLVEQANKELAQYAGPVVDSVVVKSREYDPEIEGHPSIDAELEHQGKFYKGILYFVKDLDE